MKSRPTRLPRLSVRRLVHRAAGWVRDRRGNVAVLTALMMIPMITALGMGVDYAMQKQRQDRLSGIADATALYALTPTLMTYTASGAQTKTQQFWASQASMVTGTSGLTGNVAITDTPQGTAVLRNVTVSFTGSSVTYLTSLIGVTTLPLSGSSGASSKLAPQINFYLLVDTSPSMGLAATPTDIATLEANTTQQQQGGCAFGCHESNASSDPGDTVGNPIDPKTRQPIDNYTLARNLGVTLRIDLVNQAVSQLMTTAASTATTNNTNYGVSISTIDYKLGQLYQTKNITSNLSGAKSAVGTISQLEVAYNNCIVVNNCNGGGGSGGGDMDTYIDQGIANLGSTLTAAYSGTPGYQMYKPGQGTGNTGDAPQEVLFIITDGLNDELVGGTRIYPPINTKVDNCTPIKNAGIRIAVLYLTYVPMPLPKTGWYATKVAPSGPPDIAGAARACASPGLYTEVDTGGDITGALTNLFQVAVTTAHLTK